MSTNSELRRDIKLLREQLYNLEVRCQEREDEIVRVLKALEPFVDVLTNAKQKEMAGSIGT